MSQAQTCLLMLIMAGSSHLRLTVTGTVESAPNSVVPEGGPITLTCSSSQPWFFCLWSAPGGLRVCAIQQVSH